MMVLLFNIESVESSNSGRNKRGEEGDVYVSEHGRIHPDSRLQDQFD